MDKEKIKNFFKKFWYIVWKDESLKGWIISIIFIFVIIKFVFFPLLSLATGTAIPLAIVESCSMHHEGNMFSDFDRWWENNGEKYNQFGIGKEDFKEFRFTNGFTKGDVLFMVGQNRGGIEKGDVILFNAGKGTPVIHRVVDINNKSGELTYSTIGDNNAGQLPEEKKISEERVLGKAVANVAPRVGWVKLIFVEPSRDKPERGAC